ncbi:MAG: STAS domain-containing protein [Thermoanaerobaculia bacterium]|nr:STAS domain-containing protein [Thermoanaerobaculia bacterium]
MTLEIETVEHSEVGILLLDGEVDSRSAGDLEEALLEQLRQDRTSVLLDCSDLDFISSAGLRVLVMVGKRLAAERGRLALARMAPAVREVFDVAGMSQLFAIHPDREQALLWLQKSAEVAEVSSLAGELLGEETQGADRGPRGGGDFERSSLAADLLRDDDEDD